MTDTAKKMKKPRGLARAQRRLKDSAKAGQRSHIPGQQEALARIKGLIDEVVPGNSQS
jgi:hypothetical protein